MAETAPDITRSPDAIWLSPACAEYAGDRTWAAPAPADTCEECPEPWVRYVREDLATPAPDSEKLREALEAAVGLWAFRCTDAPQRVWLEMTRTALGASA